MLLYVKFPLVLYSTLRFVMRPDDNPAVKIEGGSAALSIYSVKEENFREILMLSLTRPSTSLLM